MARVTAMKEDKESQVRAEDKADTLPKLLLRNYKKWGKNKVAHRNKDFGVWQEYTWEDVYQNVKHFALGLKSMGFNRGDKLSIIGDNEPQWYWAEFAAQSLGGTAVGIFVDCIPEEVKYLAHHSDSIFVVARDQEQVDKILAIREECPSLKGVIYWDHKGMWAYEDPFVMSFEDVMEKGREYEKKNPGLFEKEMESGKGEDTAVLCYTSGTTGLPKGAMVSHGNLIITAGNWFKVDPWYETDDYLSYVAPAWITEQMLGVAGGLISGAVINFPEEPETMLNDIREIGPSMLLYTTRLCEGVYSTIQSKLDDAALFNRFMFKMFLPVGYKKADSEFEHQELNPFWRATWWLADHLFFHQLRDKIGLSHTRSPYTGGSVFSPGIYRFLRAIGLDLRQIYGSSEAGICCLERKGDTRYGSIGNPIPGMELQITKDSEILWRGDSVFQGYYKEPEKSKEAVRDGWWLSGDASQVDEGGHILYIDRVKELMELATGDKFSPQQVESSLRFSPYIKDVIVLGGKNISYISALIQIDYEIVGRWAERNRIPYTTFADLSQKAQVYDLIRREVSKIDRLLPENSKVKKFVSLNKELDPDEAELTRTRKLRRGYVDEKYKDIASAIYEDKEEFLSEREVKYRDGRKGKIVTQMRIETLN